MTENKVKKFKISKKWIIILLVVFVIGWFISFAMKYINNIPKLDENVKASWSQVINNYKSRTDLIPNLVATVKGYAKHEKEALVGVINARAKATQMNLPENILTDKNAFMQFQSVQNGLTSALSKLMVVVEKYPDLKANKSFIGLQSQIEGMEARIRVARKDYIVAVKEYNLELRVFPNYIVASIFHPSAEMRENFVIAKEEESNPKVNF